MTKLDLMKKIARLESINDHLNSEIHFVDNLMRIVGFSNGLQTVKATAHELISKSLVDSEPTELI